MKINVNIDSAVLLRRLRHGEQRMAFAVVNAINNTAKKVQEAERARVLSDFTVRKSEFITRQAAVIQFASVGRAIPYADIYVGQKKNLLLAQFEVGGPRKPQTPGAKRVAVPVIGGPARPTFAHSVPSELLISKLHFTLTRPIGAPPAAGRRGKRSRKTIGETIRFGRDHTFLVPSVGVFQRIGRNKSVLVYAFVDHEQLPKKLKFVETARAVTDRWFHELLEREITATLARHPNEL